MLVNSPEDRVTLTFQEFVRDRKAKMDLPGDIVRVLRADPDLSVITTWEELSAQIERRMGFHAMQAGRDLWDTYKDKQRELARAAERSEMPECQGMLAATPL
jgi:hypothetical protein